MFHAVCCILYAVSTQLSVVVCPGNRGFYHLLARVAGFWVSLTRPWNSLKLQAISNTSQNHQNGSLRPPKDSKMVSKVVPETIQIMKTLKIRNLMKTISFTLPFERLGHQKTIHFPFKSHQRTCLQCKSCFSPSKSQNISKSNSKWTPIGDP